MSYKETANWPGWETGACLGKGGFGTVYVELGMGANEEGGFGFNNNNRPVQWQMRIKLLKKTEFQMDSVFSSWNDSPICMDGKLYVGSLYDDYGWEDACNGLTLWHYDSSSVSISLPNDKDIEGPQWVTLIVKNDNEVYSRTIHFTLTYNGDYKTGTGWIISNISLDG